jgi:hypothetical protein
VAAAPAAATPAAAAKEPAKAAAAQPAAAPPAPATPAAPADPLHDLAPPQLGAHQLKSARVLDPAREIGGVKAVLFEEKRRLESGTRKQDMTLLGIGLGGKALLRVPIELDATDGPRSMAFRYSWSFTDVDGDKQPELVVRRSSARAHEYGPIDVPGDAPLPEAPRERVFQLRSGAFHELPRAITKCPRAGDVAGPLARAPHEAAPADVLHHLDEAAGSALDQLEPGEVRCAVWDRWLAGGEAPVQWVQTHTQPVPTPGSPMWLEPAGQKTRTAWFRTGDGGAARLTWDGTVLQVIEPLLPPGVWPGSSEDEARLPNEVRKVDGVTVDTRLMIYLEIASGLARRALVLDPVSVEALVNEPVDPKHGESRWKGGDQPELRIGPSVWRYDRAARVWKQH